MSSLYIHIPFCRQACHYCDFHFSTLLKYKEPFLNALKKEIILRKNYLNEKNISTIYFGGGTPSLLTEYEIRGLFDTIFECYNIESNAEITLEANPEDLDIPTINKLKNTPVNRISIGIQSFHEEDLRFMNRVHTAEKAVQAVQQAQDGGYNNISIDLIYGIQTLSNKKWEANLEKAVSLKVQHISSYCLTIEKQTALSYFIRKNKINTISDEKNVQQFNMLVSKMQQAGFIHYEISNFSKSGYISRHNSHYWLKGNYIGLGPSAHSYDGVSRQWNVSNNQTYIRALNSNESFYEKEILTKNEQYNEYILTSLRTMWGTDKNYIENNFGTDYLNYFNSGIHKFAGNGSLIQKKNTLFLSEKGKLFADKIASDLFIINHKNK